LRENSIRLPMHDALLGKKVVDCALFAVALCGRIFLMHPHDHEGRRSLKIGRRGVGSHELPS